MADEAQEQPQTNGEKQTDDLPEIAVDLEDAGTLKKKVTVTVPRKRIDAKMDEMFGELTRTAQVPGFRIGRAPRRLLEKRFGREVSEDVRNAIVGESIGQAAEKTDLKTLGSPEIDTDKIELPESGDMEFSFEVEVAPEFDLPQLKGIKVSKPAPEVTDERIDEYLQQWRLGQAKFEPSDGPAADGDVVTAGAKISVGEEEPLERPGLTLRVAPGQIEGLPLVNLPEAIIGKKVGDLAELSIKVSDAHPNESWRGKEAKIELAISQIRRRILPKLDDELAASVGFDSLADFRRSIAGRMKSLLELEVRRAMREQVCDFLLENTQFDLPAGVVARHTGRVLQRRYIDLLYRGMPREQIDERLTELQAEATEQAKRDLKLSFILGKVAEQEKIEVGEDEVNARVAEIAGQQGRRPERLRQELARDGSLEAVGDAIREEKAMDKLLENAQVSEVAKDSPAGAAGKDEKEN